MRLSLLLAAAVPVILATPVCAGETVDQSALVPLPVEVRNSGTSTILCQAEIAHWFATVLATIAPGGRASLDLRFDPPTGTWAAMNARGEALPVERAWCGVAGRTYATRWTLELSRDKPQARQIDCQIQGEVLACH